MIKYIIILYSIYTPCCSTITGRKIACICIVSLSFSRAQKKHPIHTTHFVFGWVIIILQILNVSHPQQHTSIQYTWQLWALVNKLNHWVGLGPFSIIICAFSLKTSVLVYNVGRGGRVRRLPMAVCSWTVIRGWFPFVRIYTRIFMYCTYTVSSGVCMMSAAELELQDNINLLLFYIARV